MPRAVGHPDPPAGALDRPGDREVVEHLRADPAEPARAGQRRGVDDEELPVRGAQRRAAATARPGAAAATPSTTTAAAAAPAGPPAPSASWRGHGREQVEPGAAQHRDRRRDGVRGQQRRRRRRTPARSPAPRRELGAGVRLARQPGGGGVPRSSRSRGSPSATARTTSAVPSVEPSSRTSTSRSGTPRWARTAASAGATRCASSRTGMATVTGSATAGGTAGGTRSARRLRTWWAVPATASAAPTRTAARPHGPGIGGDGGGPGARDGGGPGRIEASRRA